MLFRGLLSPLRNMVRDYSSSETALSRKCATTTGAVELDGLIVSNDSMRTKRRDVPWRLPKLEKTRFLASVSSSATRSRLNGWSLLLERNVPLALYAFMARATRGDDLTSTARVSD